MDVGKLPAEAYKLGEFVAEYKSIGQQIGLVVIWSPAVILVLVGLALIWGYGLASTGVFSSVSVSS